MAEPRKALSSCWDSKVVSLPAGDGRWWEVRLFLPVGVSPVCGVTPAPEFFFASIFSEVSVEAAVPRWGPVRQDRLLLVPAL